VGKSQRKPIRNNVRKLRRERKWTQWQLAQISRLSERTIQRIERGARMGMTAELALAGAFEVEISELYASAPSGKRSGMPPDVPQRLQTLKRLVTGAALLDVIEAGPFRFEYDEDHVVEEFFQYITAWNALRQEIEPSERGKACQVFQTKLDELDAHGVWVFGAPAREFRQEGANRLAGWLVFKRSDAPQIVQPKWLRQFGKAMCFITAPMVFIDH
jgi:DNA-binding XRE family transcriptional regulator